MSRRCLEESRKPYRGWKEKEMGGLSPKPIVSALPIGLADTLYAIEERKLISDFLSDQCRY
jgi:hypothetical protein